MRMEFNRSKLRLEIYNSESLQHLGECSIDQSYSPQIVQSAQKHSPIMRPCRFYPNSQNYVLIMAWHEKSSTWTSI